eukprot:674967-Prymnesium_polylepis.1
MPSIAEILPTAAGTASAGSSESSDLSRETVALRLPSPSPPPTAAASTWGASSAASFGGVAPAMASRHPPRPSMPDPHPLPKGRASLPPVPMPAAR